MRKSLILLATIVLSGSLPAQAQDGLEREANCLLIVKGHEMIRSKCKFSPHSGDGSFQITAYNGKYFAYVNMVKKGEANGYWNEEPYAGHAHTSLGILHRQDACWVNDEASVCAW